MLAAKQTFSDSSDREKVTLSPTTEIASEACSDGSGSRFTTLHANFVTVPRISNWGGGGAENTPPTWPQASDITSAGCEGVTLQWFLLRWSNWLLVANLALV